MDRSIDEHDKQQAMWGRMLEPIKQSVGDKLLYLASPYSHSSEAVRQYRADLACNAAVELTRHDLHIFSPIVHSHPMAAYGLAKDWDYWKPHDRLFLNACGGMIILQIPGYASSRGVWAEYATAVGIGMPVWLMDSADSSWPVVGKRIDRVNIDWCVMHYQRKD